MAKQSGTKKQRVVRRVHKKLNDGMDVQEACNEVEEEMDISNGYAKDMYRKYISDDEQPRTEVQKAICEVYDKDPSQSYKDIARKVEAKIGTRPTESSVSDYTTMFRNDIRKEVEVFTEPEDHGGGGGGSRGEIIEDEEEISTLEEPVQIPSEEVDELVERTQNEPEEEPEADDQVVISLEEEQAFALAKKLIQEGEMEDVAKELMREYK